MVGYMARRIVFYLVRDDDGIVLEVSEFIHDCFDKRRVMGLSHDEAHISHEWVDCGSGTK